MMTVPNEELVVAWQNSNSPKEAAEKLGMKISSVNTRVNYLRRKGVHLKEYPSKRKLINVQELNNLIDNELNQGEQ